MSRLTAVIHSRFCVLLLMLATAPFGTQAQDYKRVAPQLPTKLQSPSLAIPSEPAIPIAAVSPDGSQAQVTVALKGLVVIDGSSRIVEAGVPVSAAGSTGINVSEISELNDSRFTTQLTGFLGRPLTLATLDQIKTITTTWLRAHQRPFVDVSIPPQNIGSGVVQMVVTEYKIGNIEVRGSRYFSESLITRNSGLQTGNTLRLDDLQTDLDRLNRNPFLNVDAVFKPGEQTGETDVTLNARDRLPLRFYAGYDNLGVRSLGVPEYNVGANWGNTFGTGQILSYQFTSSISGRSNSHSISDTIPTPWGDQVLIFGSYGTQRPFLATLFNESGHSGQASVRYVHLLPRAHGLTEDLQLGYDFKTTDNNLEFAGFQVFAMEAEVDQFPLIYDATLSDHFGQTAIQNTFVYSPGRLTTNNTTAALSALVPGSAAHYLYNRFLITRTTPLLQHFTAVTRVTVQASNRNLPYSEQVGGGGVGSVRGYYTDTALGSTGQMFSQELRLPAFDLSRMVARSSEFGDKAQIGGFFDYARLRQVSPIPDVQSSVDLASGGFLTRYSFSRNLDFQFDLGWRLRSAPTVPSRGAYGQLSVTGSF